MKKFVKVCGLREASHIKAAIKLGVDSYRQGKMMIWDPERERLMAEAPERKIYKGSGINHDEPRRRRR